MSSTKRNVKSAILLCIIISLIVPSLTGCNLESFMETIALGGDISRSEPSCYIGDTQIDIKPLEKSSGCYLALSDNQKMIYSVAFKTLQEGETTFTCCGVDYNAFLEEYGRALVALFQDYPEFFWVTGQATASAEFFEGRTTGNVTVELEIYEHWKNASLEKAKAKFANAVKSIVHQASKLSTDYEKVKFVHDFIIQNTVYDYDTYNSNGNISAETSATVNTAYGPLVKGISVCSGYARAFELIMQRLGIEASCVDGAAGGDLHEWNVVKIDGDYYHIDLTWDDAGGEPCEIVYHYFCLSERDISKTHTLNRDFGTVAATSNKYNYYIKEGCYLQEYNFDKVNAIVAKAENKNEVSIRFADIIQLNKAQADLVEAGNVFKLEGLLPFETYRYVLNKDICVLTLIFDSPKQTTE